jgi:hypothetical protein
MWIWPGFVCNRVGSARKTFIYSNERKYSAKGREFLHELGDY